MSYRYMRVLVLFDLPMVSAQERRIYSKFRKYLLKNGFLMMQESVYCKMALNQTASSSIMDGVRKNCPKEGIVQMLSITEKQYGRMECICGEVKRQVLDTDERLILL